MQKIITESPNLFEPNVYITFYVEISGTICMEDLKNAIKAAYRANEATMSRIVLGTDGVSYYEKMTESGCKVEISQDDWHKVMQENEKLPFALECGELVRCFLFPSGEKISLMIMAHHLAGDGKAIMYLIESIMNALSGAEPAYTPLSLLTPQNIPKTGKYPLIVKLLAKHCNKKWLKQDVFSFSWNDYYSLHKTYWEAVSSHVHYRQLSREETALIKENARRVGVSVNSYIVTAFLQADSSNRIAGIAVSVREKGSKSMTNLTSGISITHPYADTLSFSENAKRVHRKITKELKARRFFVLRFLADLSPALMDGVLLYTYHYCENRLLEHLSKAMGYSGKQKKDVGITNLTVIDIPAVYENAEIREIIFIPPNVSYSRNIIGVSTFNGEMTLVFHGTEDNREEEGKFFAAGIANLTASL